MSLNEEDFEVLDFSQNLNPLGLPDSLLRISLGECLGKYGSSEADELRNSSAEFLGIRPENVTVGVGATQILFSLPKFLNSQRAVIPQPTFWEYEVSNRKAGIPTLIYKQGSEGDFLLDLIELNRILKPGDSLYIANICNPTSKLIRKSCLLKLIRENPEVMFVIDETYLLFHEDFSTESLSKHVHEFSNLFVVLSLSKIFAIPGARVGLLVSNSNSIDAFHNENHILYSVPPLSLSAAGLSLKDTGYLEQSRNFLKSERKRIFNILQDKFASQLHVIEPDGNFILIQIKSRELTDYSLSQKLLNNSRIKIRLGSELPGLNETWFRVCIRTSVDNERFIKALEQAFN